MRVKNLLISRAHKSAPLPLLLYNLFEITIFYYHYYYYGFFIALGNQFPRTKKLLQIVKLYVCLGWSKNWTGRIPKEWQRQTEQERLIATDRRWNRKDVSRGSSKTRKRRWRKDERKSQHAWWNGPKVSNAGGKKGSSWSRLIALGANNVIIIILLLIWIRWWGTSWCRLAVT